MRQVIHIIPPCGLCDGRGILMRNIGIMQDTRLHPIVKCPQCNGTGKKS